MGCENLGSFIKSLSLLVSKKTRPSIRPPDGNPVHRVFRWYCIGSPSPALIPFAGDKACKA